MKKNVTRREALKGLSVAAGGLLSVASVTIDAANRPVRHLTPEDAEATALSYHENADSVSPRDYPDHKPGEKCGNCAQLGGQEGEAWRPCTLMAGKLVSVNGWCLAYFRRP
jgi:hypothetical protein